MVQRSTRGPGYEASMHVLLLVHPDLHYSTNSLVNFDPIRCIAQRTR